MRLFELDTGPAFSLRAYLSVKQGEADDAGQSVLLPFDVVRARAKDYGLAINSPDGLIQLKNLIDPAGDVIAKIMDNGSVILNTKVPHPDLQTSQAPQGKSPSVDSMAASGAKKLSPEI